MSGVFMDGGGGDSIGGDGGIDHGGHDHASHGISHGHGQGGNSFLAQILGLDQQDHAHLAHHGGEGAEGQAPSQTPAWNSALQGLKLENLIAGINITPNFLLFALFASFVGWLGVIYWIRHHEPFANLVLGSSAAYAPTVGADRVLINDCRQAAPLKTSAQSGIVYVPQPSENSATPPAGSQVNGGLSQAMASAFGQTPSVMKANPAQAQSYAASSQTYQTAPQASSPVNQGLSAAMASAFGGQAGGAGQPAPMPNAAMPGGLGNGRLFSNRYASPAPYPMAAQAMPPGGAMAGGGGARLFSSRRSMMAQAQPRAPQYSQPASLQPIAPQPAPVNPNSWSLANQGDGTFSADTAQFNSQFGAPLDRVGTAPGALAPGSYPVTGPAGTRMKVLTDK